MRPRLVLFGDSITEQSFQPGGWGAALADCFARQADVVLRGLSGYNTRWALKVLPQAMEGAADPAAVTIFFGANDASLSDRAQAHQHVPLEEYQSNLRAICGYFKERWPSAAIILITPPPIYEPARIRDVYGCDDSSRLPERTNEAAGAYAQACIAVGKELDHPVIDIWTKMQEFSHWQTSALRALDPAPSTNPGKKKTSGCTAVLRPPAGDDSDAATSPTSRVAALRSATASAYRRQSPTSAVKHLHQEQQSWAINLSPKQTARKP